MGYTHYWTVRDLDRLEQALPQIAADFQRLLPHLPPLAGSLGQGKAKIGPKELVFNGPEPEDYESFVLSARLSRRKESAGVGPAGIGVQRLRGSPVFR